MPKTRVFVSSAYIGLADLRANLSNFLAAQGYEPVLFEKGGVGFDHSLPLDESCYKAVADCDLFILVIGGRYGSPTTRQTTSRAKKYNSVTKQEYLTARDAGIPIYTFVDANVHSEFGTWRKNRKKLKGLQFAHVDNDQIFDLIHEIYALRKNNLIQTYATADDIVTNLRSQLAAIVQRYAVDRRARAGSRAMVRINPYKLFFHRHRSKLSYVALAERAGVDKRLLRDLEAFDSAGEMLTAGSFPSCESRVVGKLESVLQTPGRLLAGRPDDFLSAYIQYYAIYKNKSFVPTPGRTEEIFPTRAVVFDFDGTLTKREDDETTWEKIWKLLGYSINECARYHAMFTAGKITHEEWCDITLKKFRARRLTRDHMSEIAQSISLVAGTAKTLRRLREQGLRLYLLSGSIKQVISDVLGSLIDEFHDVRANEFRFDASGHLETILGTRYDFEGKADYLRSIMRTEGLDPLEVLFVGNSCNDVFASQSGARTLCVNPRFTDPDNVEHWTYFVRQMRDLKEVLPFAPPDVGGTTAVVRARPPVSSKRVRQ